MKRVLLAGAVAALAAIALPAGAQAPATGAANAAPQTSPGAPTPSAEPGAAEHARPGPEMRWRGGWAMDGGPMMRHMMMRRMMQRADPQQRCIDRLARRAARYAYIEVELGLTAAQRPLWDKLASIARSEEQKERGLCDQLKPGGTETTLARMDSAQAFLSARLAALQSARPAVEALYQALTAEQKAIFDRPFGRD